MEDLPIAWHHGLRNFTRNSSSCCCR